MQLTGATALVTGASQRLGAAIATALATAGARVVIHHHHSGAAALALRNQLRSLGGAVATVAADLAQADAAGALVERAAAALGQPLTILVNNAAIFAPGGVRDTTLSDWQRQLAINLTAPFLLMQAFARQLPEQASGRIVNLLDRRVVNSPPGHAAYTSAKSALWSLTQQAAVELAPRILVNAVGPGPILPAADQDTFQRIAADTPLGRAGTPAEVAEAVLFLLRHDYLTGQLLCVDGGEHLARR